MRPTPSSRFITPSGGKDGGVVVGYLPMD